MLFLIIDALLCVLWIAEAVKCFGGVAFSPTTCGILCTFFAIKYFIEIFKDLLR
jgi:hypothetical protein